MLYCYHFAGPNRSQMVLAMAEQKRGLFLIFFLLLSLFHHSASSANGGRRVQCGGSVKLFVFGDSYADTGNSRKQFDVSWKLPYGITFPGKPAGRFSDGRVLTDYIASFLGIKSPVPYKWRKVGANRQKGMNFAHGGTGVFNTKVDQPNMTTQIDMFQNLLDQGKIFTKQDLNSSIALLSLAGNDYATFLANHGNLDQDIKAYTATIIRQLVVNVRRIQSLGVPKMAVTAIEPMGCIPQLAAAFSSSDYHNCSDIWNSISISHNQMLQQEIQKLNMEQSHNPPVVILDLYTAFMSAIKKAKGNYARNLEVRPILKPCCEGVSSGYFCGSLGNGGERKYSVCTNPNESIFWDTIHPTQNGWLQAFALLKPSLHHLCH